MTPSAFTVSTMVITRLPLMMAPVFATTTFVRALFSILLPVSVVAAISFLALLLYPTLVPPLPASTPTRPFGLPLVSVSVPVIFMPLVISFSPVLFIPGPLPIYPSIFMVLPVLPPASVIPAISVFVSTLAPSFSAATATSFAFSSFLVPVRAA